ncbi:AraC-like DNA-binding protein [Rhizobium aquaticum]|uniref:AraC-like DNA-binding protein n=1 Tax=Rhizobium aquaticum TaxID=1549636 RepID=A0ABV2IXB6_9HYPH
MNDAHEIEGSSGPLESRDRARFWRAEALDGLECLSATFRTLQFAPHTHETFCIGVIEAGVQKSRIRGSSISAGAGTIYLINPDVIHEGRPDEDGYRYRMMYPSVEALRAVAEDAAERHLPKSFTFPDETVVAPQLAAAFLSLHRQIEAGWARLELESHFQSLMLNLMNVFAGEAIEVSSLRAGNAVRQARDLLDACYRDDVGLTEVANAVGLSRAHLIRAFKKEFGMPPHGWLTDRRIRAARTLLEKGAPIADTAFDCGFADQAHLTRQFKARTGVTPAVYRNAHLDQ